MKLQTATLLVAISTFIVLITTSRTVHWNVPINDVYCTVVPMPIPSTPGRDYSKCQDGMIKHIFDDRENCFCRGMSGPDIDCNNKYIPLCKTLDFRGEGYKKIMPSIKNETICKNMVERYLDKNDFTSAPR